MQKIIIVIPTYNEAENIEKLIGLISKNTCAIPNTLFEILVVDDNSPDNTAVIVRDIQTTYPNLHILCRNGKKGIGSAYIDGINHVLNKLDADILFQMDADFSHNPKYIPSMIKELEDGHDIVIGSRYISGSQLSKSWPLIRLINSKICNMTARRILGINKIKDCTGGFRAIKTEILRKVNLNEINADSYSFQIIFLYKLQLAGAKIKEIPILFNNRLKGKSKMNIVDTIELVFHAFKYRK